MKYLLALVSLSVFTFAARAQEKSLPETLMSRHPLSCNDVQYNCVELVPELHAARKTDTLNHLMWYWRGHCGASSFYLAYVILQEIRERRFTERLYDGEHILTKLQQFLPPPVQQFSYYKTAAPRSGPTPGDSAYRKFISGLAKEVLQIPKLTVIEHFLADYYAAPDERKIQAVNGDLYRGSVLRKEFDRLDQKRWYERPPDIFLSAGVWIPTGKLGALGTHPYLGISAGSLGPRWEFGVSILVKFLSAPQEHLVRSFDSLFRTNYFFGVNAGLDVAYAIAARKRHRLDLLGGLGFDGLDLMKTSKRGGEDKPYSKSLASLDIAAGAGYRIRISQESYVGLQAKYHVNNFCNTGGTDLNGHAITIGAVLGFNGAF